MVCFGFKVALDFQVASPSTCGSLFPKIPFPSMILYGINEAPPLSHSQKQLFQKHQNLI